MICPNCQHSMVEGHQCPVCAYYSAEDAELCPDCGVYKLKGINCKSPKCFEDYRQKKNDAFAEAYGKGKMETVPGCAGEECELSEAMEKLGFVEGTTPTQVITITPSPQ